MSSTPTDFQGCVSDALRAAIEQRIPHSRAAIATVNGGGSGHFSIDVTSPAFAGLSMLESQWLVYVAIGHLLQGSASPVRAVDSLQTRAPSDGHRQSGQPLGLPPAICDIADRPVATRASARRGIISAATWGDAQQEHT
jgi:stress-induced morphogen